jgi:hypothetical protein
MTHTKFIFRLEHIESISISKTIELSHLDYVIASFILELTMTWIDMYYLDRVIILLEDHILENL